MQKWSLKARAKGRLAFVPTMGALHDGHVSLIRKGHALADKVVVSIFVNPLQFDRREDLDSYPRDEEEDLEKCRREKVDVVFIPDASLLYPAGFQTKVSLGEVTKGLCGGSRPGHFDGVATVVLKLFNIVQADLALFGEKDFQQLLVIRQMVRDLNIPIKIVACPTVREKSGLAMSSRNRLLTSKQRDEALSLYRSITKVKKAFSEGERNASKLVQKGKEELRKSDVRIDYAEIRDAETLGVVDSVKKEAVYAVAAFVGPVRLIDNVVLKSHI